jgi:hypothetical protein
MGVPHYGRIAGGLRLGNPRGATSGRRAPHDLPVPDAVPRSGA